MQLPTVILLCAAMASHATAAFRVANYYDAKASDEAGSSKPLSSTASSTSTTAAEQAEDESFILWFMIAFAVVILLLCFISVWQKLRQKQASEVEHRRWRLSHPRSPIRDTARPLENVSVANETAEEQPPSYEQAITYLNLQTLPPSTPADQDQPQIAQSTV